MKKFYTYSQLINKLNKLPEEFKHYRVLFTPGWDGIDYNITHTKKLGRRIRPMIREFIDNSIDSYDCIIMLNSCNPDHEVNFVTIDNKYYTLSSLNYSIGQDTIYFCIRRIG
jgi:hypothetical protein